MGVYIHRDTQLNNSWLQSLNLQNDVSQLAVTDVSDKYAASPSPMEVKPVRPVHGALTISKRASGLVWYCIRAYTLIRHFNVCFGAFTKLRKATISFVMPVCPSVRPHKTTRLILEGFFLIFYMWAFFENLPETSTFVKIGQEQQVLHMKTNTQFWSYPAQFFLEWEMFQIKFVQKIKIHILCSIAFFDNRALYETIWKKPVEPGRTQWQYGACAFYAWYLRLQTHAQNI